MLNTFTQVLLGVSLMLLFGCTTAKKPGGSTPDPKPKPKTPLDIIKNKVIWDNDLSLAIAYLEAVEKTGAKTIQVYPNALVQAERFANANQAASLIRKTNSGLAGVEQLDLFKKVQKNLPFQQRTSKVEVVNLAESDSVGVGIKFAGAFFFKESTLIATVQKELGAPEKITQVLIEGRGEERPYMLTLYGYSNGMFRFAVADIAAIPGTVERVYLDVPTLVNALKKDLK